VLWIMISGIALTSHHDNSVVVELLLEDLQGLDFLQIIIKVNKWWGNSSRLPEILMLSFSSNLCLYYDTCLLNCLFCNYGYACECQIEHMYKEITAAVRGDEEDAHERVVHKGQREI